MKRSQNNFKIWLIVNISYECPKIMMISRWHGEHKLNSLNLITVYWNLPAKILLDSLYMGQDQVKSYLNHLTCFETGLACRMNRNVSATGKWQGFVFNK